MPAAEKVDLYKLHKAEYAAPKGKPVLVDVGPAVYLAVEGEGEPGGEVFTSRIGALYSVAYTVKMTRKFSGRQDYKVCQLEGQWWIPGGGDFFSTPKPRWQWRLLIRTPEFVTAAELKEAIATLTKKGKSAEVKEVARFKLTEGRCVQMLHVGPYDREPETIARMHEFAAGEGLVPHGLHHEIYFSDPRRVPPERLRTLLRHPVTPR